MFVLNFVSFLQQMCSHMTQKRIHYCCCVSVVKNSQVSRRQRDLFTRCHNIYFSTWLDLYLSTHSYFENIF